LWALPAVFLERTASLNLLTCFSTDERAMANFHRIDVIETCILTHKKGKPESHTRLWEESFLNVH
jgi:hypothetical protein